MDFKLQLVDAMNTYSVALLILKEKNYDLGIEPSEDETELGQWYAEKDGRKFWAWDPLRLLGLVSLWENRGDDWFLKKGEEQLYNKLIDDM